MSHRRTQPSRRKAELVPLESSQRDLEQQRRTFFQRYILCSAEVRKKARLDVLFITPSAIALDKLAHQVSSSGRSRKPQSIYLIGRGRRIPVFVDNDPMELGIGAASVGAIVTQDAELKNLSVGAYNEFFLKEASMAGPEKVWQVIRDSKATIVGWSFDSTAAWRVQEVMQWIVDNVPEEERSDITFIGGGYGPTVDPEWTLRNIPLLRAVVQGPGDVAPELINRIQEGRSLAGLNRVSFWEQGELHVANFSQAPTVDLDNIPAPDYDLMGQAHHKKAGKKSLNVVCVALEVSGSVCNRLCRFCAARLNRTRARTVEKLWDTWILPTIAGLQRTILIAHLFDLNADPNKPPTRTLLNKIDEENRASRKTGKHVQVSISTTADAVAGLDQDLAQALRETRSLRRFFLGVESLSPYVLWLMGVEKTSSEILKAALKKCHEHDFEAELSLIVGYRQADGSMVALEHDLLTALRLIPFIRAGLQLAGNDRGVPSICDITLHRALTYPGSSDWEAAKGRGRDERQLYQELFELVRSGNHAVDFGIEILSDSTRLENNLLAAVAALRAGINVYDHAAVGAITSGVEFQEALERARNAYRMHAFNDYLLFVFSFYQTIRARKGAIAESLTNREERFERCFQGFLPSVHTLEELINLRLIDRSYMLFFIGLALCRAQRDNESPPPGYEELFTTELGRVKNSVLEIHDLITQGSGLLLPDADETTFEPVTRQYGQSLQPLLRSKMRHLTFDQRDTLRVLVDLPILGPIAQTEQPAGQQLFDVLDSFLGNLYGGSDQIQIQGLGLAAMNIVGTD